MVGYPQITDYTDCCVGGYPQMAQMAQIFTTEDTESTEGKARVQRR